MATKNFLDIHGNIIEDILCVEEDSHGLMCPEDKVKLDGIEDGAQKNVQSDWNQNDESADDYIKNKTHGEKITYSDTLTWDGNTEGLKDYNDDSLLPKYRISNVAPTLEQLQNGVRIVEKYFDGTVYQDNLIPFNQMTYHEDSNDVFLYGISIQLEDRHYPYEIDGVQYEGVVEKGVYFIKDFEFGTYTAELQIPGFTGFETVEIVQLDPKYIPSPSDEEMLELLMEMEIAAPTSNNAGALYVNNNGKVYTL